MTDREINLPPMTANDHPECRVMKWSNLELDAINRYAEQAVLADRAERAKPERKPMTDEQVYASDELMEINAGAHLPLRIIVRFVRATEAFHNIKDTP